MLPRPVAAPPPGWVSRVPRLARADIACWLLKTARLPAELTTGREAVLDRCLRRSYRLDLLRPGDRCVLWRSGAVDPGVCAVGAIAGEVGESDGGPVVAVRLLPVPPVPRTDLLADPAFRDAEVLRMPAGSNPSWLSSHQFAAVLARLPAGVAAPPGSMGTCEATGSGGERSAGC
jgi:hypothetical protein